ncbi:class I SAM-dependent methyltransferase [Candidatus Parcubacteria bacterium]|nr:class I SAM-dependent methyltransferase [Candidatus Parcubacteria bacterium]
MVKILECPLCGSKKIEKFYEGIDKYYSGRHVECAVCNDCSLIFLNPRPTEEEYKEWYESVFQDKRRNINTVEQVVAGIVRKNKYKNKLRELGYFKNFADKNAKCLEIGCGWGTLAKVVKDKFDCEIDVIEPSKLGAKVAQEYFNLNVYNETFESFSDRDYGSKKYDLIYSYHVFEHIIEPNVFLEKVKKLLGVKGILLLALPDTLRPEQPSERLFHIDHCFYYTKKTLEMMLNKHGFKNLKFWKCATDMKIICAMDESVKKIAFKNSEEYKKVRRAVKRSDIKYKIFRFIKKILYIFLNENQKIMANNAITRLLKRFK